MSEKSFESEVKFNYFEGPENGSPLLLLHGTMNRWQAFQNHLPAFTQRWHVYAPDYRGHGKTDRTEHYGYEYFYNDVLQFIEKVIKKPTVVFGHSLGGRIGLKLAAEKPSLIKGLILGDSSLTDPQPSNRIGEMFGRMLPLVKNSDSTMGLYASLKESAGDSFNPVDLMKRAKNLSQVDPRVIEYLVNYGGDLGSPYGHFTGYHPSEHLKKVRCSVLILQAEKGMLKDEDVENALSILSEVYAVKLPGVPHEFLNKEPFRVIDAVNAFLELLL